MSKIDLEKWNEFLRNLKLTDSEIISQFTKDDILKVLGTRNTDILLKRKSGKTFSAIAKEYNVNNSRARQIYLNGITKLERLLFKSSKII